MAIRDPYGRPLQKAAYRHNTRRGDLNLVPYAGDPAAPSDGDLWYNSTLARFRKHQNGATSDLSFGWVPSGSTLPSSPGTGLFWHTPTGRKYLMAYDGSSWIPVLSSGATTLYVNGTSGTDSQDKGFGTGSDAYDTIQYAINQLPSTLGGSVTLNIAGGAYPEAVTVQGKQGAGAYTITLQSTLNVYSSGTAAVAGSVQGSGATQGTVVCAAATWTSNEIQNKILRFTDATTTATLRGVARLVDSNTTTTATIVGVWPAAPASGDTFDVHDWGTNAVRVNPAAGHAFTIKNGNTKVVFDRLFLDPAAGYDSIYCEERSVFLCKQCRLDGGVTLLADSSGAVGESTGSPCFLYFDGGGFWQDRVVYAQDSRLDLLYSKVDATSTAPYGYVYGLFSNNQAFIYADLGTVLQGQQTFGGSGYNSNGVYLTESATAIVEGGGVSDVRVRDWDRGVRSETVSGVTTYSVSYSGNTTNESADAGSYGYIA